MGKHLSRAVLAVLAFFLLSMPSLASEESHEVYTRIATNEKVVALTFDDGPHPRYTPMILDILAEYDAKATFFVIGRNVELYGEHVRRAVREGHEIGNHTYGHVSPSLLSRSQLEDEILRNEGLIEEVVGEPPELFRPPEGYLSAAVRQVAKRDALPIILWNVDTRDWAGVAPDEIARNVMRNTEGGSIILFHDYIAKDSPTPRALKKILPQLRAAGYRFLTVSELLSYATPAADAE